MLKRSRYSIGIFFAACIILFGILFSISRGASTYLHRYQPEFEDLASQAIGYSVEIGQIKLGWYVYKPVIKLVDVVILDENSGQVLMENGTLSIGIKLISSIRRGQIQPNFIYLSDAIINYPATSADMTNIKVIDFYDTKAILPLLQAYSNLQWFRNLNTVILDHVRINWIDQTGNVITIKDIGFFINRRGASINLSGIAQIAQEIPTKLQFSGMIKDTFDQARLTIKLDHLMIDQWLKNVQIRGIGIAGGVLAMNTTLSIEHGQIVMLASQINLQGSKLVNTIEGGDRFIKNFTGRFYWKSNQQGWRLHGRQINLNTEDITWNNNYFDYKIIKKQQGDEHCFYINTLNTALFSPFLPRLETFNESVGEMLTSIQPSGELSDLNVSYFDDAQTKNWEIKTDFHHFSWEPWEKIPGAHHVTGSLLANPQHGKVQLDSENTALSIDNLFDDTIYTSQLIGEIIWDKQTEGWAIKSQTLQARNPIVHATGRFSLFFPFNETGIQVDIKAQAELSNLIQAKVYLPKKILSPGLYQWLNTAIHSGGRATTTFILKGNMKDFPFDNNEGEFTVDSDIYGVDFDYQTGWPLLNNMDGKLIFHNRGMHSIVHAGRLMGTEVNDIMVKIPDIGHNREVVEIKGDVVTNAKRGIDFIQNSPLIKYLSIFNEIEITGRTNLSLEIEIPIDDVPHNSKVLGMVKVTNNHVNIPDWSIQLSHVSGELQFNQDAILDSHFQATFLGQAADITLRTKYDNSNKFTVINFNSQSDLPALANLYHVKIADFVQGQSAYQGSVKISHEPGIDHELVISSDLSGATLLLPEPLKKTAATTMPFNLAVHIGDKGYHLTFNMADALNANIAHTQDQNVTQLFAEEVHYPDKENIILKKRGFYVAARLSTFSLEDWYDYYQQWMQQQANKQQDWFEQIDLNYLDIQIDRARVYGQTFSNLGVNLYQRDDVLSIMLRGNDVNGTIKFNDTIQARLNYLHLKEETETTGIDKKETPNPEAVPALDIIIEDLRYQGQDLGELTLLTNKQDKQMGIEKLSLHSDLFKFDATGAWNKQGDKEQTHLKGTLLTDDFGSFLQHWDLRAWIGSSDANFDFNLTWDNPPTKISLHKLNGDVNFTLKDGYVHDLSPAAKGFVAVGKVFDLLDIDRLPSRLRLDFSDLFNFGYNFSIFQGRLVIKDSVAVTENTYLEGSVSYIGVESTINFVKKTHHSKFTIIPHVAYTFTGLAAILGKPIAAVVTWVVNTTIEVLNWLTKTIFNKSFIIEVPYIHIVSESWE